MAWERGKYTRRKTAERVHQPLEQAPPAAPATTQAAKAGDTVVQLDDTGYVNAIKNMSPECVRAILQFSVDIPKLVKDAVNEYSNYLYVPIDTYYELVRRNSAIYGLLLITSQIGKPQVNPMDDRYRDYDFGLTLVHVTGTGKRQRTEVHPNIMRTTISHRLEGPQTAGSVQSYADKVFLRSLFKIETGEPDADAEKQDFGKREDPKGEWRDRAARREGRRDVGWPNNAWGNSPPPKPEPVPRLIKNVPGFFGGTGAVDFGGFRHHLLKAIGKAQTRGQLDGLWTAHAAVMRHLELADKPLYDATLAAFKDRGSTLGGKP